MDTKINNNILGWINKYYRQSTKDIIIEKLAGDASNRSFYRARFKKNKVSQIESLIIMRLNSLDSNIIFEEIVTISKSFDELPYINIMKHLEQSGVRVPRLYYFDKNNGLLYLEDCGNVLLREIAIHSTREEIVFFYKKAIDELLKIHLNATNKKNGCFAFKQSFNRKLFIWEFNHFLDYGIEKRLNIQLDKNDRTNFNSIFADISKTLSSEPKYFSHRDYHSDNILVYNETIVILDFQDALMALCQYDLASLLTDRDIGLYLGDDFREELVNYYIAKKEDIEKKKIDRTHFKMILDYAILQRALKVAGRFNYIAIVKNNHGYLKYLPPTYNTIKAVIEKHGSLKKLKMLLTKYFKEFD